MARWRHDGREIYYLAPDNKMMAVAVAPRGATWAAVTPEALFQAHPPYMNYRQPYDVSRDGRFLITTDLSETSTEPIHVLLNWKPPK